MESPIKPTVGRIVLFSLPVIDHEGKPAVVERAAVIARVWERSDGLTPYVNLLVFRDGSNDREDFPPLPKVPEVSDPELATLLRQLVARLSDVEKLIGWKTSAYYDETGKPYTWRWMPYQLGQAARTEAAEKALAEKPA